MRFKFLILLSIFTKTYSYPSCSILYENVGLGGLNLRIPDNGVVSDLNDEFNQTRSFAVSENCILTLCNERYLLGDCTQYKKSEIDNRRMIQSANCTCMQDCKCKNIMMGNSDCARAYIGENCNSCNAHYYDLQTAVDFPFVSQVASLMVKEHCELRIFDEEEFNGDSKTFTGVHEIWEEPIGSYQCVCKESNETKKYQKNTPSNYKEFLNISDSLETITSMINGNYKNHEGLLASLKSMKNKRSPKNAYILLLGTTGAGKSSTINLLLGNLNITKVGEDSSTTSDIHEFRIPISIDKFGIANSELRIIDTPGLGDTKSLESDAKYLATLNEYLTGHEELSKYMPNIILVVGKFYDNRFAGEGGDFVKMLRSMDLFRNKLIDNKSPNVVFVLTHLMSETPNLRRNPTDRIQKYKSVIGNYSLFSSKINIALAENKAFQYNLLKLNGNYKLPNGEYYPKNLIKKIEKTTSPSIDPIGSAIFQLAFNEQRDYNEQNITSITIPLVNNTHEKFPQYLHFLLRHQFQINQTEISNMLSNAFMKMPPDLKLKYPDSLFYLQRAFNLRNMNFKSDIPQTIIEKVKFIKEIELNNAIVHLLETAFEMRLPSLKEYLITGSGYNVFKDTSLPSSPFKLNDEVISKIGFSIPKIMNAKLVNQVSNEFLMFKSKSEYLKIRLDKIGVKNIFPINKFEASIIPGYNIQYNSSIPPKFELNRISGVRKFQKFQFALNDKLEFNADFLRTVQSLKKFNNSDKGGIALWSSFFDNYGTHVVNTTSGGGEIEIILKTSNFSINTFDIIEFVEDYGIGVSSWINSSNYVLNFKGGDAKFHVKSFKDLTLSDSIQILENWKNSLDFNPSILPRTVKLIPMSMVVKTINSNLALEVQKATEALFADNLKYDFWREKYEEKKKEEERLARLQREHAAEVERVRRVQEAELAEMRRKEEELRERIRETERQNERRRLERLAKEAEQERENQRRIRVEAERLKKIQEAENHRRQRERERDRAERERQIHLYKLSQKKWLAWPAFTCGDGHGFRCWHNDWRRRDQAMSHDGWDYKCSFSPWFGGRCYCTAVNQYVDCYC